MKDRMKRKIDSDIIDIVIDFYLTSGDFNGIPLSFLLSKIHIKFEEIESYLSNKIKDDDLRILSSDNELNPHIIRTGFQNIETQLRSLRKNNVDHTCIYPGIEILKRKTSSEYLTDQPFRRELALGRGQLDLCYFELMLLELYRNDPRYYYNCNDIGGRICIKDEHYKDSTFDERDKVLLERFGLAYDNDGNRYIAAFLRDLANLSPEHQRIWQSKIVNSELKVNPDFYGSQILGQWAQPISIFDAILHEQRIINDMVFAIGKPPLFKRVFGRYLEEKPKEFSFMIRPTAKEYHDFVHLLDKLFSDNIDKKFFKGELALEVETKRKDGKSLSVKRELLSFWMNGYVKFIELATGSRGILLSVFLKKLEIRGVLRHIP